MNNSDGKKKALVVKGLRQIGESRTLEKIDVLEGWGFDLKQSRTKIIFLFLSVIPSILPIRLH